MNPEARAELDRISQLTVEELTEYDVRFLKARRSYLGKRAKAKFKDVLEVDTPVKKEGKPHGYVSGTKLIKKAKALGIETKGVARPDIERAIDTVEGAAGAQMPE